MQQCMRLRQESDGKKGDYFTLKLAAYEGGDTLAIASFLHHEHFGIELMVWILCHVAETYYLAILLLMATCCHRFAHLNFKIFNK